MVIRSKDLNDRRKVSIFLTDAGKIEMEDMMRDSTAHMSKILGNADPGELLKFVDSLRYAVEFMQKIKKGN